MDTGASLSQPTNTSFAPGSDPDDLLALAAALRDKVAERRLVVSAFQARSGELSSEAARAECLALAKVAGALIEDFPGAFPIVQRQVEGPSRGLFRKRLAVVINLKVFLVANSRKVVYTSDGVLRNHASLYSLDSSGNIYCAHQALNEKSDVAMRLLSTPWVLLPFGAGLFDFLRCEVGSRAFLVAEESVPLKDVSAPCWQMLSAALTEGIALTTRRLETELTQLESVSSTHGLPR